MNPMISLLLCWAFIIWLFRHDNRQRQLADPAMILPFLLLFIVSSRPVSFWIGGSGGTGGGAGFDVSADLEGNPVERVVLLILSCSTILILIRRIPSVSTIASRNLPIVLFYIYFLISTLWAEYPFVSLKRWYKDFGLFAAVMLLLTHKDVLSAVRIIYVRCAYLLIPLSVVFIKWFPAIGRRPAKGGDSTFIGITVGKNSLGAVVLIFSLMLLWDLLEVRDGAPSRARTVSIVARWILLIMAFWLLITCQSTTSQLCLGLALCLYWATKYVGITKSPRLHVWLVLLIIICLGLLNETLRLQERVAVAVGKSPTLTGRTEIWAKVLNQPINPIVGCGFLSFWTSSLGVLAIEEIDYNIKSTHNGYLEVYVDGGVLALILLVIFLFWGTERTIAALIKGDRWGRLRFTYWVVFLVYQLSESNLFRLGPVWFTMLVCVLETGADKSSNVALRPVSDSS